MLAVLVISIFNSDIPWVSEVSAQKCSLNTGYTDFAYLRQVLKTDGAGGAEESAAALAPPLYNVFDGKTPSFSFQFQIDKDKNNHTRSDWELHAALDF